MCGIAGIIATDRLHADERVRVLGMRDVLEHRGPDEAGLHIDDLAALAHRRLSIVDLATGQQPLSNEDGSVWVVYNGEIYNHADVRADLETRGHVYRTRCDTETIVHAYEEWGDACVDRFRGMFAFAIWDAPRRRALLVRDRLGIKPLYWCLVDGRLIFGSEIKAILESGLIAPRPNEERLPELLSTRYISGVETLFRGIYKLLPGHLLVFDNGRVEPRKYWDLPLDQGGAGLQARPAPAKAGRQREVVDEFRARLDESVRLRLMSDVPLGMFLSGGLDSSVIAALMARHIGRRLQTFSVAFKERDFSELSYARAVARSIDAEAHEIVIDDRDFFDALPRLVWHEDEPIAHPSSVPLYFVSKLAREHVKVVLTGEGSDELLAGYGKYPRALLNWRLGAAYGGVPAPVRRIIARQVIPRLPERLARYARRSFLSIDHAPAAVFFDAFASIGLSRQRELTPRLAGSAESAYGPSIEHFERPNGSTTLLQRVLYADIKTYLVELLMKQDQMSMATSIESRVPFLDHTLVEFVFGLPDAWKLSGFDTKRILRAAARDLVPREILTRRKMGFPVPFGRWTRGPWRHLVRDVLLDKRARERGLTDPVAVGRLLADHTVGRRDCGDALWGLLNLELWYRTFIDGEGAQTLPVAA
jgi:asparagine synthase (glutamine-hydrolysing)